MRTVTKSVARCDICHDTEMSIIVDGLTKTGQWGNMCEPCFHMHGTGLGVGRGQQYVRREGNLFVKVAG